MYRFGVRRDKEDDLAKRLERLGVAEADLEEKFVRSSGRGGRKRDKTSSCVYLRHVPTGIEVKCSRERSQSVNRFLARRSLADRLEEGISGAGFSGSREDERRLRRQKKRRERRSRKKYGSPV